MGYSFGSARNREELIRAVWDKGIITPGQDPWEWRKDDYGNWIRFPDYGNRDSVFGWEIDHIKPVSQGGTNQLSNLRPLWWRTNVERN